MTIAERKQRILEKIEQMKAEGADLQAALSKLGVEDNEPVAQEQKDEQVKKLFDRYGVVTDGGET